MSVNIVKMLTHAYKQYINDRITLNVDKMSKIFGTMLINIININVNFVKTLINVDKQYRYINAKKCITMLKYFNICCKIIIEVCKEIGC